LFEFCQLSYNRKPNEEGSNNEKDKDDNNSDE